MIKSCTATVLLVATMSGVLTACGSGSNAHTTPPVPAASSTAVPQPAGTEINPPGDIPDNQAFVSYSPGAGTYKIEVPEGWARTVNGSTVSFTDKLNTVTIERSSASAAPTVASATSIDVPALKASVPKFTLGTISTFSRPGGPGVLITYTADSAPDPVTNKVVRDDVQRYVFWRNGQQVVITLSAPKGSDNVDPWARITGSFRWV